MSSCDFKTLLESIKENPLPSEYDAYFVFTLLKEFKIEFRFLKAMAEFRFPDDERTIEFFLPVFEIDQTPFVLSHRHLFEPQVFNLEMFEEHMHAFMQEKRGKMPYRLSSMLKEEPLSECTFYDTVGRAVFEKVQPFKDWKLNFERALLERAVPHASAYPSSPRI